MLIQVKIGHKYITKCGRFVTISHRTLADGYGGISDDNRTEIKYNDSGFPLRGESMMWTIVGEYDPASPVATNTPRAGEQDGARNRTDSEKLGYDAAIAPKHYQKYAIEPFLFIRENELKFWQGNVIKYVLRAADKNGLEDLRKAMRNIELEIFKLQGRKDWNIIPSRLDKYEDTK